MNHCHKIYNSGIGIIVPTSRRGHDGENYFT